MALCPELTNLYGVFYEARQYSERLAFERYGNYPPESTRKRDLLGWALEATEAARLALVEHAVRHGCGKISGGGSVAAEGDEDVMKPVYAISDTTGASPTQVRRKGGGVTYAPRILIVDNEVPVQRLFETALSQDGYYVTVVGTVRQALNSISDTFFDIIVSDMSLPDMDGSELIRRLRLESPCSKVLAVSGYMEGSMSGIAIAAGATTTLVKPTTPHALRSTVYRLLDPSCEWIACTVEANRAGITSTKMPFEPVERLDRRRD